MSRMTPTPVLPHALVTAAAVLAFALVAAPALAAATATSPPASAAAHTSNGSKLAPTQRDPGHSPYARAAAEHARGPQATGGSTPTPGHSTGKTRAARGPAKRH